MSHLDGFQCERLAAAILQEQGYVCEVCELRTHRYTADDGGERYQNRVDYFGEFDVIAVPTYDAPENRTRLLQVTRNRSNQERTKKMESIGAWADRHEPTVGVEFWYWGTGEVFLVSEYGGGSWGEPVRVEPGLDADKLLARHDESIDQEIQ